ncbi:MAG TPA: winged helix-turn-helix transcriptional regulator, partial [Xanthobacteraceae bacterium]
MLGAVERGSVTQRRLSLELGIAVGLVNAYIRRCVNKGWIKVKEAPPRRYAYYLTPKGFIEKSQLVATYFIYSFDFFRSARASCKSTLLSAVAAGYRRIALIGASDLTEIALIVATEIDVEIVAVVDKKLAAPRFLNIPVKADVAELKNVDAVVITALVAPQAAIDLATKRFGAARVLVPSVLANMTVASSHSAFKARG